MLNRQCVVRCCCFIITHSLPPFSDGISGQGFVESDGTSGHKKNALTMITMTGFMNSHEINKIPVLYIWCNTYILQCRVIYVPYLLLIRQQRKPCQFWVGVPKKTTNQLLPFVERMLACCFACASSQFQKRSQYQSVITVSEIQPE